MIHRLLISATALMLLCLLPAQGVAAYPSHGHAVAAARRGCTPSYAYACTGRAHWTKCTLHYRDVQHFLYKRCSHYAITQTAAKPTGHWWRETVHTATKRVRITYPTFAPAYSLPGCPWSIARWAYAIIPASRTYGTAIRVLTGVMAIESGGNPFAVNPASGAAGLYQFLPSTAAAVGVNPYDPVSATDGAARYIHDYGISSFSGFGYGYGEVYARSCD